MLILIYLGWATWLPTLSQVFLFSLLACIRARRFFQLHFLKQKYNFDIIKILDTSNFNCVSNEKNLQPNKLQVYCLPM